MRLHEGSDARALTTACNAHLDCGAKLRHGAVSGLVRDDAGPALIRGARAVAQPLGDPDGRLAGGVDGRGGSPLGLHGQYVAIPAEGDLRWGG